MSTCDRVDTVDWLGAGVDCVGDTGFGVLGSAIPSSGDNGPGYAYDDISLPADANTEICGRITTWPVHGTLVAYEDTSFIYTATSDGADSFAYQLYKGGVASGSPITQTLQVGGSSATAPGAILAGAASISGGSATATTAGTAPGATLTGSGTVTGGAASGTKSATASGATLAGAGTIQGGAASGGNSNSQTGTTTITVPESRTAVFAAHPRVAVFTDTGPVGLTKSIADQLYIVGDFTKPLNDGATTPVSTSPVMLLASGVTVLEGPVAQGSLMIAKLGTLDPAGGQITFRVACVNGEIIDGTINLTPLDDRTQLFGKDPDDRRFYALDVSADLALSGNTTIATVQTPIAIGVTALSVPAIQGGKAIVLMGGLDLTDGATNSCELVMTLASTEVIHRTVYFSRQDH